MSSIFRFFDFFLPANLRSNPADLMRGYILIGLITTNILISLIVLLILLYFLDLEQNTRIGVGLNMLCLVAYLAALALLKRTQSFRVCANFLLATLAAIIVVGIQITGGYMESPVLQLALQLPVTAFLLLGLHAGILWLLATALICLICYLSVLTNFGYVQLLQNQALIDAMYVALQYTLFLTVGGALVIYEVINSQLTKMLNEERNRFEHKASHDDLTGIPNRFEFFRRLKNVIDEAREREHKVGIVYIDLDGFKPINDLLGHHMGDEALKSVASRLQKILRLSDTTARLGGDEFALILPGIHVPHDIEAIMPKVLDAIKKPIHINGVDVVVKASCGVAVFPNHSEDHSALCRYADLAMYRAKEEQDAYLIFDESMKSNKS
ncbi:MAG: GGDEF domain-containing protein [Halioglobus sp.]